MNPITELKKYVDTFYDVDELPDPGDALNKIMSLVSKIPDESPQPSFPDNLCPTTMKPCEKIKELCSTTCWLTQKMPEGIVISSPNKTSVTIDNLLDKQKALRDLIYVRPFNLKEIESKAVDLCDAVIDFYEQL